MKDGNLSSAELYSRHKQVTNAVEHVDYEAGLWGGYRRGLATPRILRSGIII
jgi:hypothetical protein